MRVIGKIIRVILVGILLVVLFAMDQVAKVYSLISGCVLLLCGICLVLAICIKRWDALLLLGILTALIIVGFIIIAVVMISAERIITKLKYNSSL